MPGIGGCRTAPKGTRDPCEHDSVSNKLTIEFHSHVFTGSGTGRAQSQHAFLTSKYHANRPEGPAVAANTPDSRWISSLGRPPVPEPKELGIQRPPIQRPRTWIFRFHSWRVEAVRHRRVPTPSALIGCWCGSGRRAWRDRAACSRPSPGDRTAEALAARTCGRDGGEPAAGVPPGRQRPSECS